MFVLISNKWKDGRACNEEYKPINLFSMVTLHLTLPEIHGSNRELAAFHNPVRYCGPFFIVNGILIILYY